MSVRHALLALLSEGPKYGLRLRQEFEARTGEMWPLNVGQVYTTLQRLERDGLVETDGGDTEGPQKGFRITGEGRRELAGWLRAPAETGAPPRDELVIKVLVALIVPGVDVHEVVQAHRRGLVEAMQRYTRLKASAPEDDVALALVADAELFRLEAIVRWLDAADARLARFPRAAVAARPIADPAGTADTAGTADPAGAAGSGDIGGTTDSAGAAGTAGTAGTAGIGDMASTARVEDMGGTTDSAGTAAGAGTGDMAGTAGAAGIGDLGGTAGKAGTADPAAGIGDMGGTAEHEADLEGRR